MSQAEVSKEQIQLIRKLLVRESPSAPLNFVYTAGWRLTVHAPLLRRVAQQTLDAWRGLGALPFQLAQFVDPARDGRGRVTRLRGVAGSRAPLYNSRFRLSLALGEFDDSDPQIHIYLIFSRPLRPDA